MAETEQEAALLARHTDALRDALARRVPQWAAAVVESLSPEPGSTASDDAAARVRTMAEAETVPELERLLGSDIDAQWCSPLDIVRKLVPAITDALDRLGAEPRSRDPRSLELMPHDTYAITPATFADIHPSLHEPGLAWGAAKAHVHLRRHATDDPPVVVVFAPELGDRSRFDHYDVTHVRSAGKLHEFAARTEPDLVIVDLDRTSAPADFRIDDAHVVGFGSHVDTERQDAALDAGFDAVVARSVFFRRLPELLAPVAKANL
ncbi:MAG: hypothetical protein HKN24_05070 [Acidimicrobiales bacterium]|nr:hypothetical protein [Acidimicrobiales bacterium]